MLNELQNDYNENEDINDIMEYESENIAIENSLNNNKNNNIKVFCRFRPPNEIELSHSTNNALILVSREKLIFTQEKNLEIKKEYTFDGLFDIKASKELFYKETCKPIISYFLQGYNGSIINFGETGTGKTYIIKEIIPSIISQIFNYIDESDNEDELFKIEISSIEIYNEKINDLLDKNNQNLNIIQNEINNLTNISVNSQEQMSSILNELLSSRNKNELQNHNSKSHFIIIIKLHHYFKQKNSLIFSKLFLTDLQGSECLSKNILEEKNIEEQKLINKSLIALSIIVNNLSSEQKDNNYIPYRDSKLTHILRECFGGNCFTNIILTCSKHEKSSVETRNTLMFGEKAKKIVNNPIINVQNNFNQENKHNLRLSEIKEEENEKIYESFNNNSNEQNIIENETKFLKIEIKQLKDIIEQNKIYIEELNERNNILELEKKNLNEELEKLILEQKQEEKKETINSEYLENNIDDFHQLLNEKEINEKKMKEEINRLKLILVKNNKETSDIINKKNDEIMKIKEEQNNQMQTFQELMFCIEQASNQIQTKDKKIEELLNIIKNNENKAEENRIDNNNDEELKRNINILKKENENLKKELNKREELIININKEKNSLLEKKREYDNRIAGMTKLINKMKSELENKNNNKEIEIRKITTENNIQKNKIQSLENNINTLTKSKNDLEISITKLKKEFTEKYNTYKAESESQIEELQNEIDTKNKISIELHNLKIKYQNLLKTEEQKKLQGQNMINNLKAEIETIKNESEKKLEKLESEKTEKENILKEKKIIYEKNIKEINSYQNLISKLKKENASLNNIIIDLNTKIENQDNNKKNNNKIIKNLEDKIHAKEFIANDYKIKYEQIMKENLMNKNAIKTLEENNKTLLNNFDIIKAELNKYETDAMNKEEKKEEAIALIKKEYIKEIEKYQEIIKQKDIKINEINNKSINDNISIEKILSLQKEISELKVENNQLYLKIKEMENKEKNDKKEPMVYLINKDINREKIKNAYSILIKENEQLKNNIIKLKEYHH